MAQAISAPVLTQEEVLTALIALGEDPTASRVAALHHCVGATSLPAGVRADAVLQVVAGARSELIDPAIDRSAGDDGAHRYDGLRGASIELLRDICCIGLEPGEIWRPCVTAHMKDSHWFWTDAGDDMPERHGPFSSEVEALLNAIDIEGIEDPQNWGLSSRPVLRAEAEGKAWTMANMLAAKDTLLQAGWTKDRDAPALYRKDGETFELNSETIHRLPVGDANPERGHSGLPAFASRFGDADRYSVPVESRLVLFLPLTPFRPEPMRVSERSASNGSWYEVETYNAGRDRWTGQKEHDTAQAAITDARDWYPDPGRRVGTPTFTFNNRSQGIFADGFEDRHGLPVRDTFAYSLRASLYGPAGKGWSKEQLSEFVSLYSSEEMALLMGEQEMSRYGAPVVALVTIGASEWPFFVREGEHGPSFLTQDHNVSYEMVGDATTSDHVMALKAQYGNDMVRAAPTQATVLTRTIERAQAVKELQADGSSLEM